MGRTFDVVSVGNSHQNLNILISKLEKLINLRGIIATDLVEEQTDRGQGPDIFCKGGIGTWQSRPLSQCVKTDYWLNRPAAVMGIKGHDVFRNPARSSIIQANLVPPVPVSHNRKARASDHDCNGRKVCSGTASDVGLRHIDNNFGIKRDSNSLTGVNQTVLYIVIPPSVGMVVRIRTGLAHYTKSLPVEKYIDTLQEQGNIVSCPISQASSLKVWVGL